VCVLMSVFNIRVGKIVFMQWGSDFLKEQWIITDDPLFIRFGGIDMYIELAVKQPRRLVEKYRVKRSGFSMTRLRGIANELVARAIPKNDIIIGFHCPFKRQFIEFTVN
jgi:hypothetical protein